MKKNILCADIGTSSLKAAVINEDGEVLAFSRRPFLLYNTSHASKEWLPCFQNAVTEIFSKNPSCVIDGICISGNGPSLVFPTGETYLWNVPLEESVSEKNQSVFIPRILSLKKKYPQIWENSDCIFSAPEYLIYLLTQKKVSILPSKDFYGYYWTDDALIEAGLSRYECRKFPDFIFSGNIAGYLDRKSESFLNFEANGLKEGLPVFCGAPDFISALVGTGTITGGALCDRAGSSEGLNFCTQTKLVEQGIRTMPSVISGLWNASVLIPESGSRFYAFKEKAGRENGTDYDFYELVKKCLESGGNDITFEEGKLIMTESAEYLKTAVFLLKQAVVNNGADIEFPDRMVISGGLAANELWVQFKADVTGMQIDVPECTDAELLGDAVFAFKGAGVYGSIQEACSKMCRIKKSFFPREDGLELG